MLESNVLFYLISSFCLNIFSSWYSSLIISSWWVSLFSLGVSGWLGTNVTPFDHSTEYNAALLSNMKYEEGTFSFDVISDSYELGVQTPDANSKMCANSGKGQHIHLIVGNAPYAAKYVPSFEHDIADGEHYLLAFLSRSYHESIKSSGASIAKKVTISNKNIKSSEDITSSMLFYSRPKGTYVGKDTKKVMLDYYMVNVLESDGYSVLAEINGKPHELLSWQPYYIEGLPMGENTITLTLINKNGGIADIPNNPVSRTFTLKEELNPEG